MASIEDMRGSPEVFLFALFFFFILDTGALDATRLDVVDRDARVGAIRAVDFFLGRQVVGGDAAVGASSAGSSRLRFGIAGGTKGASWGTASRLSSESS
ncbi:MAG: hypothetical protein HRU17_01510 [Polyangiaceae bacterium]|nr:hypothetical protein [Polyangiaceae bacterium]